MTKFTLTVEFDDQRIFLPFEADTHEAAISQFEKILKGIDMPSEQPEPCVLNVTIPSPDQWDWDDDNCAWDPTLGPTC